MGSLWVLSKFAPIITLIAADEWHLNESRHLTSLQRHEREMLKPHVIYQC